MLYAHPAVAEAAVVGMRDPLMGEEVLAFVALKPGATTDAAALLDVLPIAPGEVQVPQTRSASSTRFPRARSGRF